MLRSFLLLSLCLLTALFLSCNESTVPDHFELPGTESSGMQVLENFTGMPDTSGIISRFEILLPEFVQGCYYTQEKVLPWPLGANRILPYPFKDLRELDVGGVFICLELQNGNYLSFLPVAGEKTISWMDVNGEGKLILNFGNLGTEGISGDFPLYAWCVSGNLYDACYRSWKTALEHPLLEGSAIMRENKEYPGLFRYLGWCSWEEYRMDINEQVLVSAHDNIVKSGIPVRYMLIDDGHQYRDPGDRWSDNKIRSFAPDTVKFPNGWQPLISRKNKDHVRWMGLWHSFNADWRGISRQNVFGEELQECFREFPRNTVSDEPFYFIEPGRECAEKFYGAMIGSIRDHGFDFAKIDAQSVNLRVYENTENAVEASVTNSRVMEEKVNEMLDGLINCMYQNVACIFNTRYSSVARASIDYKVGDFPRARLHTWQSYSNTLWLGQTVWGDHDMFHSNDPVSGRLLAVSKAMSAAPVYLSDAPENFVPSSIWPLCYTDGRLVRPIAPAFPVLRSVFLDPMKNKKPYLVVAPLANRTAAVVAYNFYDSEEPVTIKGKILPEDYTCAPGMIQPYPGPWDIPAEGLIAYDWELQEARMLEDGYPFELTGFSDKLVHLIPVRRGWAPVGLIKKYLSPATLQIIECTAGKLVIELQESGPFAVYSDREPRAEGIRFRDAGNGLFIGDIEEKPGKKRIEIQK